ncbi:MAG: hypothetical protein ACUVQT_06165, partial [bacterium]
GEKFLEAAKKYLGVPFAWGGRSRQKLDCMGLIFLSYSDKTGRDWRNLSICPTKLVKSKRLGSPVSGFDGILREDIDYIKLKKGDIIYFLTTTKINDTDPPLVQIDSILYYSWHMGIFAGLDTFGRPLCLHAKPNDRVVIEPLEEIYFDAIFVTRLGGTIESREVIVKNLEWLMANNQPVVIHTFVALCDNEHQGIAKVPSKLGNGEDPENNLYWGAGGGIKTYFRRSEDWRLISSSTNISANILERCIFKKKGRNVYMIADAYRGSAIKDAITDFLNAVATNDTSTVPILQRDSNLKMGSSAQLLCYVGHNGLLDFQIDSLPEKSEKNSLKDVIILSCLSKNSFYKILDSLGGYPLLWTTGLVAPEAYTLKAAIDAWIELKDEEEIKERAVNAYNKFQRCGLKTARKLFVTGW